MIKFKHLFVVLFILIFASCTKVNTTTLGQGLIPAVDNVNTFATDTFNITSENALFNDTSSLYKSDDHIIGQLPNTSIWGSTDASIYVQFNPLTTFSWSANRDSIKAVNVGSTVKGFDSAFVCLGLTTNVTNQLFYGDTTSPITFKVYKINPGQNFVKDSTYKTATLPNITYDPTPVGEVTYSNLNQLRNYNYITFKGVTDSSVNNQIRIKFNTYGQTWVRDNFLQADTSNFNSRDLFTTVNNGFVIKATTANACVKIGLNNTKTHFEVWYKFKTAGIVDTAAQYFYFNPNATDWLSGDANYIKRTTTGSTMLASTAAGIDQNAYLESTPGSYTKIKIPGISSFPNKMIHRAELELQEDPAFVNTTYTTPLRLMLDCIDTLANQFKAVPYDLYVPTSGTAPDFLYFGGYKEDALTTTGLNHSTYTFNITKYFQNIITRGLHNYDLRLYVPYDTKFYSQNNGGYFTSTDAYFNWPVLNSPTFGRVVIGGGTHPNYKMKLKVIYSNI